jgi:catalase
VESESLSAIYQQLASAGAVPRYVGITLGPVEGSDGAAIEADVTLEAAPPVLFDALVLPAGAQAVEALAKVGQTMEFLKDQYRHCKPILVLGESAQLLVKAGIPRALPNGEEDEALIITEDAAAEDAIQRFTAAIARHRNFARDSDPPPV